MSLTPVPASPERRGASAVVVVVAVLVAAGLAVAGTAAYFELRPPGHGTTSSARTVSVIDDLGRTVTVPWNASRVVILGANLMDSFEALGLRSHVVGVDCSSGAFGGLLGDYTPAQVQNWSLSSSMCVQAYPQPVTEQILNLSPAIVLASSEISESYLLEFQNSYGIPVVVLAPTTLGGIVYDIEVLSAMFSTGATGPALVAALERTLQQAASFDANLTNNGTAARSVLLTYYVTPASSPYAGYSSFGPATFGESLVELAGGLNVASASSGEYPTVTGSQLLAADPSCVVAGTGFGIGPTQYAGGPDWSSAPAVQAGNVTYVDVTLMTEADPGMVFWIPTLAGLLHPGVPFV